MPELSPKQSNRIDGIRDNCERLLRRRGLMAARIRPEIATAVDLLIWQTLAELRKALSDTRAIGGGNYLVADVLATATDDDAKIAAILTEDGEASLFADLCPPDGDANDPDCLDTYYGRLDPSLSGLARLVARWAWWDLPDAVDQYVFEQAAQRYGHLKTAQLNEQALGVYRTRLGREEGAEVTREDILAHEEQSFERLLKRFAERRDTEPVARRLPTYESGVGAVVSDKAIMDIATALTAVERIEADPVLDPRARSYYGETLGEDAQNVTRDAALEYERANIARMKADIVEVEAEAAASPEVIHDCKRQILERLTERFEALRGSGE